MPPKTKKRKSKSDKTIIIATRNENKIKEFEDIFKHFQVKSLLDYPNIKDVDETEKTFEGNARLKAEAISKELNTIVIADDSGLCVNALNGAPGVYSARYAGNHDDKANNKKLLEELENVSDRSAYYVTVIAIAIPGKETIFVRGELQGDILEKESSKQGFSYDTLFKPKGYNKAISEITNKNEFSHRKIAAIKALNYLLDSDVDKYQ